MLSLPGLHSAAKKKKNLVEEKHPEDRGCERDDRTREIRDGRRGEEKGVEGQWTERRHTKMQDRPPVLFSWVQGPLWQRSPLPNVLYFPLYTHIHTHTSNCQTFHKPPLQRGIPASKWDIDSLCIIVKVTHPKSQPVIDPFPCTTQTILQHGSPKKQRQWGSKESACWSFRSTEMKEGWGEAEQMCLCGQWQRSS